MLALWSLLQNHQSHTDAANRALDVFPHVDVCSVSLYVLREIHKSGHAGKLGNERFQRSSMSTSIKAVIDAEELTSCMLEISDLLLKSPEITKQFQLTGDQQGQDMSDFVEVRAVIVGDELRIHIQPSERLHRIRTTLSGYENLKGLLA